MSKGAAYIRVSTEDQLEFSPNAQKRAILEYAHKNNIAIENEFIFIDEGISGRNAEKRPAFMNMIALAKKKPHPFDVILVHKFDRFARNREDSVVYKSLLRRECGIRVVSISEQLEDDKFSIILESMLEAMAEYYSLNLADEVRKGMFEKARRGEHIGKAPFGYDLKGKNLIPNIYEFEIIRQIFDLYTNECYTISSITAFLYNHHIKTKLGNDFRNCTIKYILENPLYAGLTRYNYITASNHKKNKSSDWIMAKGTHSPAISYEVFEKAKEKLCNPCEIIQKPKAKNNIKSWCQQLAICDSCGKHLSISTTSKTSGSYASFFCRSTNHDKYNGSKTISTKKLEKIVLDIFENDIPSIHKFYFQKTNSNEPTKKERLIALQLKKIDEKMSLSTNAYLSGIDTLDEYGANKLKLNNDKMQLNNEIDTILKKTKVLESLNLSENPKSYSELFSSEIPNNEKIILAHQFIKEIRVNFQNQKIKIIYYV